MPNLPPTQPSNTTKRTPCSHQAKNNMEIKMQENVKATQAISYELSGVKFFSAPNNIGNNTNVSIILFAGEKSSEVNARVDGSGYGFILSKGSNEIAFDLGVTKKEIDEVINTVDFDVFCEESIESRFWAIIDSLAAESYINRDDGVEVLYDCQVASVHWFPVVVRKGKELCVVAVNRNTGEVKVAELDEDDLLTIADELEDKPWSDVKRAKHLLSWVGA